MQTSDQFICVPVIKVAQSEWETYEHPTDLKYRAFLDLEFHIMPVSILIYCFVSFMASSRDGHGFYQ